METVSIASYRELKNIVTFENKTHEAMFFQTFASSFYKKMIIFVARKTDDILCQ